MKKYHLIYFALYGYIQACYYGAVVSVLLKLRGY